MTGTPPPVRTRRVRRRTVALLLLAGALAGVWFALPDRLDPWAPLDLAADPGPFAWVKLRRLAADPAACRDALAHAGIAAAPAPEQPVREGCGIVGAVQIDRLRARLDRPAVVACPVAAALHLWERDVLQPAARVWFGQDVARIQHLGSYNCRNIAGSGRRSQHATANAIDIAGFTLRDGRQISVLDGWDGAADEAGFLRRLRDGACPLFSAALGPDYNAAHRNHFHFDLGPWPTCR